MTITLILLIVFLIIVDRFAEIYLNIKYPLYMDVIRMRLIVIAIWALNVIAAATFTVLYAYKFVTYDRIWQIYDIVILLLDSIILSLFIITYSYFYFKVKSIKQADIKANYQTDSRQNTLVWKKFKIPTLMVSTYVLFNISGKGLSTMASFKAFDGNTNTLLYNIAYLLDIIAFLADGFIYIILQKEVRRKLQLWRNRSNRVQIKESDVMTSHTNSTVMN